MRERESERRGGGGGGGKWWRRRWMLRGRWRRARAREIEEEK